MVGLLTAGFFVDSFLNITFVGIILCTIRMSLFGVRLQNNDDTPTNLWTSYEDVLLEDSEDINENANVPAEYSHIEVLKDYYAYSNRI